MCQMAALAVLIYSLLAKATKHSWAYRSPSERGVWHSCDRKPAPGTSDMPFVALFFYRG